MNNKLKLFLAWLRWDFKEVNRLQIILGIKNEKSIHPEYKTDEKIYESPDGETIFERTMLNSERKKIK